MDIINQAMLKILVSDHVIRLVTVFASSDGWFVVVEYGGVTKVLCGTNTNKRRYWSKLDSLNRYLFEMGVKVFQINSTDFTGDTIRVKRPDRAEAMNKLHSK